MSTHLWLIKFAEVFCTTYFSVRILDVTKSNGVLFICVRLNGDDDHINIGG
jgi:hypothetical protein